MLHERRTRLADYRLEITIRQVSDSCKRGIMKKVDLFKVKTTAFCAANNLIYFFPVRFSTESYNLIG